MTTRLTDHFSYEELTHSELAVRRGIDNKPPADVLPRLIALAQALEKVRKVLGVPVLITSGYRSADVNRAVGGSNTSAHCAGLAADFIAPSFGTPQQVAKAIKGAGIAFDQLIFEGSWVHMSIDPRMRGQMLTAHFRPSGVAYSEGIA